MKVLNRRCAGLNVHKDEVVACVPNQETMVRRDPPFQSVPQLLARTFKPRSAQSR